MTDRNRDPASLNSGHVEAAVTPLGLIELALIIIPAQAKFVLAGMVVFAGTALVLGWTSGFSLPLTFGVAVLVLLFGLAASALAAAPTTLKGAGGFLAWALAILFVAFLVLLLSSAFFGTPLAGTRIIARFLGSAEILTRIPSKAKAVVVAGGARELFGNLPQGMREEASSGPGASRIQQLSALPELNIAGVLQLASPSEKRILSASTLRFDGGTFVTNGGDVTIEVNNLIADNGSIHAFENPVGATGNAGRLVITVYGKVLGRLGINLSGQRGRDAEPGMPGPKGSKGAHGANPASGMFDCQRGAEAGGKGGKGLPGKDGLAGGSGGNGGTLIVRAVNIEAAKEVISNPRASGGPGGAGGAPGKGGEGGDGGDGGSPVGFCTGAGPTGPQGDRGPDGKAGSSGMDGKNGRIVFEQIPGIWQY
jgi:hypothetical protein